jgi:DNA-binding beta-propeller fold protein YncE
VLDPGGDQPVYVADQDAPDASGFPGKLLAIDVDPLTGRRVSALATEIPLTVTVGGTAINGRRPTAVAVSPAGRRLYVVTETDDPATDALFVVDTEARPFRVDTALPLGLRVVSARPGMVFSKDGRLLYLAANRRIVVVNTVEAKLVRTLGDLPAPYGTLAPGVSVDPLQDRIDVVERLVQAEGGTIIGALALSPDGTTLYAAMETGFGSGQQPGAVIPIDVDLYRDGDPSTTGLQSDLADYFTLALPPSGQVMRMPAPGTSGGGDEPRAIAVSHDGKHLYLVHGGVNYFGGVSPEQLDLNQFIDLMAGPGLGALSQAPGLSGGMTGVMVGLSAFNTVAQNLFTDLALALRLQMESGRTVLSAPGFTGVFNLDAEATSAPVGEMAWTFPGDVVYGWTPNPSGGGLIVDQFQLRGVHAKRPYGFAMRPDGRRALLPYYQTGNFGVLDLDAQLEFKNAHSPQVNPRFAQLEGDGVLGMFYGVVGVTQSLLFDNHLWPSRGVFRASAPGRTELLNVPSPDEAALFTWDVQYAQNGRFAVATHTGAGRPPHAVEVLLPDFEHDVLGARFPLQQLGFQMGSSTDVMTDPNGVTVSPLQAYTFKRGGGSISLIDDAAITADFAAHLTDVASGPGGLLRSWYSAHPICVTLTAPPLCDTEVVTRHFDVSTASAPDGQFHRPRGVAIEPYVTFESPRFGDQVGTGTGVQIRWRDPRITHFELSVRELDPSTGEPGPVLGQRTGALTAGERANRSLRREFGQIMAGAPSPGARYRLEARVLAGTDEFSRTSIDVRFRGSPVTAACPPASVSLQANPLIFRRAGTVRYAITPGAGDTLQGTIDLTVLDPLSVDVAPPSRPAAQQAGSFRLISRAPAGSDEEDATEDFDVQLSFETARCGRVDRVVTVPVVATNRAAAAAVVTALPSDLLQLCTVPDASHVTAFKDALATARTVVPDSEPATLEDILGFDPLAPPAYPPAGPFPSGVVMLFEKPSGERVLVDAIGSTAAVDLNLNPTPQVEVYVKGSRQPPAPTFAPDGSVSNRLVIERQRRIDEFNGVFSTDIVVSTSTLFDRFSSGPMGSSQRTGTSLCPAIPAGTTVAAEFGFVLTLQVEERP